MLNESIRNYLFRFIEFGNNTIIMIKNSWVPVSTVIINNNVIIGGDLLVHKAFEGVNWLPPLIHCCWLSVHRRLHYIDIC